MPLSTEVTCVLYVLCVLCVSSIFQKPHFLLIIKALQVFQKKKVRHKRSQERQKRSQWRQKRS